MATTLRHKRSKPLTYYPIRQARQRAWCCICQRRILPSCHYYDGGAAWARAHVQCAQQRQGKGAAEV